MKRKFANISDYSSDIIEQLRSSSYSDVLTNVLKTPIYYLLNDIVKFTGTSYLDFSFIEKILNFVDKFIDSNLLGSKNGPLPANYINLFSQEVEGETPLQALIRNLMVCYFDRPGSSNYEIKLFFQTELLKKLLIHDKFSKLDSKQNKGKKWVFGLESAHLNNLFQQLGSMNYITVLVYIILMKKYDDILELIMRSPFVKYINYKIFIEFNTSYVLTLSAQENLPQPVPFEAIILQVNQNAYDPHIKIKYTYLLNNTLITGFLPHRGRPQGELKDKLDAGEDPIRFADVANMCGFKPITEVVSLLDIIARRSILLLNQLVSSKPIELLYGADNGRFPLNSVYQIHERNQFEKQVRLKLLESLREIIVNFFTMAMPKDIKIIIFSYLNLDIRPLFIHKNLSISPVALFPANQDSHCGSEASGIKSNSPLSLR